MQAANEYIGEYSCFFCIFVKQIPLAPFNKGESVMLHCRPMPPRVRKHVNPFSVRIEHSFDGFANDNPIVVDVGACKGEFVMGLLERFPEKNYVVFEIRQPLVAELRTMFADYPNVVVFDGDAGRNFRSILAPSIDRGVQIETIYMNFPDPWFKDKHKKRRFLNERLLANCSEWMPAETEWVFQTDQRFLFDETLEMLANTAFSQVEFFEEPPFGIRTDWEMAKVREGSEVWRMKFKKK